MAMKPNLKALALGLVGSIVILGSEAASLGARLPAPASLAASLQAGPPNGVFRFVEDTDGGRPEAGAIITLTFSSGRVVFSSLRPSGVQADTGVFSAQGNRLTIRFDHLSLGCQNKVFLSDGTTLSLPFKVLSSGEGFSIWTKDAADNKANEPAESQEGARGDKGDPGEAGRGKDGKAGRDGRDATGPTRKIESISELVGDWEGKGVGAEVRFRRQASLGGGKFNVMTLTTRHLTEFFFHVFPDQRIEGEGIIYYSLEPDLSGVEALAGAVKGLLGLMPFPSAPSLKEGDWGKAAGSVSDKMASGTLSAGGVTSPSYSYKMRQAPQKRHFRIGGRAYQDQAGAFMIHLEAAGDYFLKSDLSQPDNKLWVDYEVNLAREESSFPTWSPFLAKSDGDALVRASAGGAVMAADSELSGTHRNGVRPWEEYTFSWSARKSKI